MFGISIRISYIFSQIFRFFLNSMFSELELFHIIGIIRELFCSDFYYIAYD